MSRWATPLLGSASAALLLGLSTGVFAPGCRRAPPAAADAAAAPTLRLYVVSSVAGAIEPCGCTKDMLGGVDHAAAFIAAQAKEAPHAVVVGAGPMLFMNPKSEAARGNQDVWKAEALARSLGEMGLIAWAPGANDWAAGAPELQRLSRAARADLLASNLEGPAGLLKSVRVVEVNGYRVGLAGISDPKAPTGVPPDVVVNDPRVALARALSDLRKQGATVLVALVATERGRALRLAEQVPGFQVMVVGKPYDQGDANDPVTPPSLVDGTLIVQAPNHLQGVGVLDLHVRDGLLFKDGTGIALLERRQSLTVRIAELGARIREREAKGASADVLARRQDLERMKKELAGLGEPGPPSEGSFFRYRTEEIREKLGTSPGVSARLAEYYRRVNDHNREAFKDRVPEPPRPGEAKYIGAEACGNCHDAALTFWKTTPHATAYGTLVSGHKEFNLDCVSCHVTGYEKPGGSTVTHVQDLESVQCEVCHGPGSLHEDHPEDPALLVRKPPKTLCAASCHHPPHVPVTWSAEGAWSGILGKGHGQK